MIAANKDYLCFYHKDRPPTENAKRQLQAVLDMTKLLVGHNIKFDLKWLRACGLYIQAECMTL